MDQVNANHVDQQDEEELKDEVMPLFQGKKRAAVGLGSGSNGSQIEDNSLSSQYSSNLSEEFELEVPEQISANNFKQNVKINKQFLV